ncbi:Lipoprotein YlpA precursor [Vibrio aerogenes CECT 7868]|uniref:Lipoprotein YlpA n=1 Tax=Vibrio aerogenes CECT 7868 TaxID=1216006 RepID=A0A1M5ZNG1_9VIBR|nr:complement resistance protein TraT [Vibrio aerogenes]SHI25731.1 Lipoprotein YlpA precursor [Vibrio aerogenes CECT 7868]
MNFTKIKIMLVVVVSTILLGCSAAQTMIKKRDLTVESKTSYAVVLEPVAPSERIVYAKVRDLSGNSMRKEMQKQIEQLFRQEGFQVTRNPKKANLMVTASIISADKMTEDDANKYLSSGYKGGVEGGVAAAGIAAVSGSDGRQTVTAGLLGAAAGFLADTLVDDVYYTFVMDVELRERPMEGDQFVNESKSGSLRTTGDRHTRMGVAKKSSVKRGDKYNWIVYETRIVTTANKMNLEIQEAIPEVEKKTAETLVEMMM